MSAGGGAVGILKDRAVVIKSVNDINFKGSNITVSRRFREKESRLMLRFQTQDYFQVEQIHHQVRPQEIDGMTQQTQFCSHDSMITGWNSNGY